MTDVFPSDTAQRSQSAGVARGLLVVAALVLTPALSGCDGDGLTGTNGWQLIGQEVIPAVSLQLTLPSVDEVTGLTSEQVAELGQRGFPTSLEDATMAHLQGAMQLTGTCQLIESLGDLSGSNSLSLEIAITNCADARCAETSACSANTRRDGMHVETRVTAEILPSEFVSELREQLATGDRRSIGRMNFAFSRLDIVTAGPEGNTTARPWLDDFQVRVEHASAASAILVERWDPYDDMTESNPFVAYVSQSSTLGNQIKHALGDTLPIESFVLTFIIEAHFAASDLYSVSAFGTGVDFHIQPQLMAQPVQVIKSSI